MFGWIRRKKSSNMAVKMQAQAPLCANQVPQHVAIIMDGNGRWAQARGLPRKAGHYKGVEVVRSITKTAANLGVKHLTVYAFSSENWRRPADEVATLMSIFYTAIEKEARELKKAGVRLQFIGDRTVLDTALQKQMALAEEITHIGEAMTLYVAINYGGRAEIVRAAQVCAKNVQDGHLLPEEINEEKFSEYLFSNNQPDPDLVIRTGGDQRISNFLLWQIAYTEFVFIDKFWPELNPKDFEQALIDFAKRNRRFGAVPT